MNNKNFEVILMIDISVIIPVFRVERYIEKCIESLLEQSYQNFEMIFVDDGTDDNSIKIVETLLNKRNFLEYRIIRQKNKGQAAARNVGLKSATGEYIVFVDSDDVVHKDFLKTLINNIKDYCDMSVCSFCFIPDQKFDQLVESDNKIIELTKEEFLYSFLYRNKNFVVVSILFRRKFLLENNLWFDEKVKFSEDQMYIWKCIFSSNKTVYTYAKLYGYFLRPNSIMTASKFDVIIESSKLYKSFCDQLLLEYSDHQDICIYIYPRWSVGVLFSTAKILTKAEYRTLYKQLGGKTLFVKLLKFIDLKTFCLSFLISFSMNLSYYICRRVR